MKFSQQYPELEPKVAAQLPGARLLHHEERVEFVWGDPPIARVTIPKEALMMWPIEAVVAGIVTAARSQGVKP